LKSSQKIFFFQGDKVVATKVGEELLGDYIEK